MLFINIPSVKPDKVKEDNIFQNMKEGFSFIKHHIVLLGMIIIFCILNFFGAPLNVALPVLANKILGVGAKGLGYMGSSFAIGSVVMTLMLLILPDSKKKHFWIIWGIVIVGLNLIFMGVNINYRFMLVILILTGAFETLNNIKISVFFQETVPDEKRGRVFSIVNALGGGTTPIALGLAGFAINLLTVPVVFIISGIVYILAGLSLYKVPGIREV